MREIPVETIAQTIAALCIQANKNLPPDVAAALGHARAAEPWPLAQQTLDEMLRNVHAATSMSLPVCQDTGMACVFIELGQQVALTGAPLEEGVNEGVRRGYTEGLLRKSIVADPLRRENTKTNLPAQLTLRMVPGQQVRITVMPKGFGSENMSRLVMLNPSDGRAGVEKFVLETARLAGPNACPPMILGVGIGASFDRVALLAKEALLRPLDIPNPDPYYAKMEHNLLAQINQTGTGPAGYGGKATALGVAIEAAPTHIAGLPVAVNISCHVTRRATAVL